MRKNEFKRWIMITGATDGPGKQLAQELAANVDENFVIVHGKTTKNCQKTVDMLIAENKLRVRGKKTNVDFVTADFAKLIEVTRMAEEIRLRFPNLNTFIACATVVVPRRLKSQDGMELTLQINHLAHVVLWNELLPLLEQNSPSRILTMGSMLHNFSSIDWNDLNCERSTYNKFAQYSRTTLMNHLATLYIHRLMFKHKKQFQVTANVVDAEQRIREDRRSAIAMGEGAAIGSNCAASQGLFGTFLSASEAHLYEHSSAVQTLTRLVEDEEFAGISGKYFDANGKELRLGADVSDVRVQDQLWTQSKLLCNAVLGRRIMTATTTASMTTTTNSWQPKPRKDVVQQNSTMGNYH